MDRKREDHDLAFLLRYENVAWYEDGAVRILDRRVYPMEERFVVCHTHEEVAQAIADMVTQSAGPYYAAAHGMALAAWECRENADPMTFLRGAAFRLSHARPTTASRMEAITGEALSRASAALSAGQDAAEALREYAVELMVNTVCADIPHTNIRMASLIGEAFDQRVTNKMVDLALETGSLTVTDDQQFFGYMNVEDAAKGILSLTKIAPETWREAYNLGSETTYTLKTMAETIADVFAAELNRTVTIAVNAGEKCLNSALNGSALLHDTGFAPQIQLSESIRRILRYKLEQRKQSQ